MSKDAIEFYDMKYRKKVNIPRKNCFVETFKTKRGQRTRIVAVIRDNPSDPDTERNLSRLCSKDFII